MLIRLRMLTIALRRTKEKIAKWPLEIRERRGKERERKRKRERERDRRQKRKKKDSASLTQRALCLSNEHALRASAAF